MIVLLVRHGKTKGNLEGRYVGRTDEPLLETEEERLKQSEYRNFRPDIVFCSKMLRCRQTAEILFPKEVNYCVRDGLEEMDFGDFEYKNYAELNGNPAYQAWIDSAGKAPFPGGESGESFRSRCCRAFEACIREALHERAQRVAFSVHGGTIMAIMEAFARPQADYYSWQVKNGDGYVTELIRQEKGCFSLQVVDGGKDS